MKKKMRSACLILALTAIFSGCKKSDKMTSPSVSSSKSTNLHAGDGLNDLLGYGYDVSGKYASSSASKFFVIDVDRLKADYTNRVLWDQSSLKYGVVTSGEDAYSYTTELTKKLGLNLSIKDPNAVVSDPKVPAIPFFKGSVEGSFSDTDFSSSKFVYSNYSLIIQQKRVKLNADNALLKQYLTSTFIEDVRNGTPQSIVANYGTHVLKDIILGAKLNITYQSETSKSDRKDAATKGLDFNVLGIFGLNTGSTSNTQKVTENINQRLSYEAIGGEPSASLFGTRAVDQLIPPIDTKAWENSSTIANAEMIDIAENGLIPIWELIDDAAKSEAVKDYVIQYLVERGVNLKPVAVHSYLNSIRTDHYYTTDYKADYGDWKYENISFYAFASQAPKSVPVYVYFNSKIVDHYYTTEYRPDYGDWKYEKIGFYAYTTHAQGTVPVYGYMNNRAGDHYYTTTYKSDYGDWKYEYISFYTPVSN
jgi:hypothetical protein